MNLDLSTAARRLMKFSLILHFFIGLYMYSNSSILTPTSISTKIFDYINTNNRYFNSQRFSNLHTLIFLCAFALMVVVFLARLTLINLMQGCIKWCKKISSKYIKDETQVSDDIIEELNFPSLYSEFKKTKYDLIEYRYILKNSQDLDPNIKEQLILFLQKLEQKQLKIVNKFEHYFVKYQIYGISGL